MSQLFDDATPDFFDLGKSVVNTPPFSVSCWFKTDDLLIDQTLISIADATSATDFHFIAIMGAVGSPVADPLRIESFDGSARGTAETSISVTVDVWHHAVGVWTSAADRRIWLDGGSDARDFKLVSPSTMDKLAYGRLMDSTPANPFSGHMAYVAVWDTNLSAIDVGILFDGISPLCVKPENLQRFDDLTEPPTQPPKGKDSPKAALTVNGTPTSSADQPPKGNHIPEDPIFIPRFGNKRFGQKQIVV